MTTRADASRSAPVHGRVPRVRPSRFAPLVAAVLLPVAALLSCGHAAPPPPPHAWPAGTVLALNGTPITADQVDAVGSIVARTEPDFVLVQLRRIALTNVLFARVAAIQLGGPRYEVARKTATELAHGLQSGSQPDAARTDIVHAEIEGGFKALGLEAWNWAMDAPIGTWSDPIEAEGAFGIVRVDSRSPAPVARNVIMKLSAWYVPYVPTGQATDPIEAALDRSSLEIIDATWNDTVPESWKRRMRRGTL